MSSRAWLIAPLVLVFLPVALAAGATAHATYASSSPTSNAILPSAPSSVTVTLSEPIKPGTGSIRVTNASSGARVDNGSASISRANPATMSVRLLPIGPGCWVVVWSATDAIDGHFTIGQFSFEVQNADGTIENCLPNAAATSGGSPVSPTEIALRFGMFLGLALAFGAALLAALVWMPTSLDGEATADTVGGGFRALFLWGRVGAVVFTAANAGLWALQWTTASGSSLLDVVGSPFLASLIVKIGLGVALVTAFAFLLGGGERWKSLHERSVALWAPVGLCVAAIAAEALATHAAASATWAPLSTLADAGHLIGVTAWVGGLLVLFRLRAWFFQEDNVPFSRQALERFSRLAFYCVGLVLVAGVSLSIFLVGSFDALFGSAYGWVVLAKVSLFAPMLALGAFNRYRHLPAAADPESEREAIHAIGRNVRWESSLGAVVLALAAILTALAPPVVSGSLGGPLLVRAVSGGIRFDFQVYPAPTSPGNYTFVVELWNATDGGPYAGAVSGYVNFTRVTTSVIQAVPLQGPHGNHFFVDSDALNAAGTWRIVPVFTRANGSLISAIFYVQVPGTG